MRQRRVVTLSVVMLLIVPRLAPSQRPLGGGLRQEMAVAVVPDSTGVARRAFLTRHPDVAGMSPAASTKRVRAAFIGALAGAIIGGYVAVAFETSDCPRDRSCSAGAGATLAGIAIGALGGAMVGVLADWAIGSVRGSHYKTAPR